MAKKKRQEILLKVIQEIDFDTQNDLVEHLNQYGLDVTQATISRDIKQLGIVKVAGKTKKYRYALLEDEKTTTTAIPHIYKTAIESVAVAQNIVVVKTISGNANAVASFLDNIKINGVVGSLAGDDTIILIAEDNNLANQIKFEIERLAQ